MFKVIYDYSTIDLTTYAILHDPVSGKYFDTVAEGLVDVDDVTAAEIELTEDTINDGMYVAEVDATLPDGAYLVSIWSQDGETPDRSVDTKIGTGVVNIRNGKQVFSY